MHYELKAIEVPGTDNIHTLKGRIYIPEGEIKGIFHIVHGMCEYIARYDHIFAFLAEKGYVCCGYDNLGHGETAKNKDELGFIAHRNGWKYLVNDVKAFEDAVRKMFPDKPLYLMGHSMGSFISRIAAENYGDGIEKFIICGTGGPNAAATFGLLLTDIMQLFCGEKHRSKLINNIAFGAYNKAFGDKPRTPNDWLSADTDNVDRYMADPMCGAEATVGLFRQMLRGLRFNQTPRNIDKMDKDAPILLIAGQSDPVGDMGAGVRRTHDAFKRAGIKDVTLKLYPGLRHEILNEAAMQDTVYGDIRAWMARVLG